MCRGLDELEKQCVELRLTNDVLRGERDALRTEVENGMKGGEEVRREMEDEMLEMREILENEVRQTFSCCQ